LLEDVLFNPLLVKSEIRNHLGTEIPQLNIDQTLQKLAKVVTTWKGIRGIEKPVSQEDMLSVDKLVELGMGDTVLAAFFSPALENGIDTLITEFAGDAIRPELIELRGFWQPREISSKYTQLRNSLMEALAWKTGPDGKQYRNKVMVVSPGRKQLRTSDVLQRTVVNDNGNGTDLYSSFELDTINDGLLVNQIRQWVAESGLAQNDVLVIDGDVPVGRPRNEVISRWVNDPNAAVMVVTLEATYLGRDFTLSQLQDQQGREISGVTKIILSRPWYFQQLKQLGGRSLRHGQLVPVNLQVMLAEGFIDQAKWETVVYTDYLSRLVLAGSASLTPQELDLFNSQRIANRLEIRPRSPESLYLEKVLHRLRFAGEESALEFLQSQSGVERKTHAELLSERFFDQGTDVSHRTGYNADFVAKLIDHIQPRNPRVLSVGSGTLLLQRHLKRPVDNVDINGAMMQWGWQTAQQYGGRTITARASQLTTTPELTAGSYGVVENSYALHWSKLFRDTHKRVDQSERVKIISEMQEMLSQNGKLILTLPERSFDDETFKRFYTAMETNFGFKILKQYTGKSKAVSIIGESKALGWCIIAEKVGSVNLAGLSLTDLQFANESEYWTRDTRNKRISLSSSTQEKEYPLPELRLTMDHFEIATELGRIRVGEIETQRTQQPPRRSNTAYRPAVTDIYEANEITDQLRGTEDNLEDYKRYRKLIRDIKDKMGGNWDNAVIACANAYLKIQQSGHRIPNEMEKLFKLILANAQ